LQSALPWPLFSVLLGPLRPEQLCRLQSRLLARLQVELQSLVFSPLLNPLLYRLL